MNIVQVKEPDKWNRIVSGFDYAGVMQSYEWGDIWKKKGWNPVRLIIKRDSEIIGALSLLEKYIPVIKTPILWVPQGPLWDTSSNKHTELILRSLQDICKLRKGVFIRISPSIRFDRNLSSLLYHYGFHPAPRSYLSPCTFWIDLTQPLEMLWKRMQSRTRRYIRASAGKLNITHGYGPSYVNALVNLMKESLSFHSITSLPDSECSLLNLLSSELGPKEMCRIFISYRDALPTAGVFLLGFGSTLLSWRGGEIRGGKERSSHTLNWEIIKWAKDNGYKIYDLGGTLCKPNRDSPHMGVYTFKKRLGGDFIRLIGAWDFVMHKILYKTYHFWVNYR